MAWKFSVRNDCSVFIKVNLMFEREDVVEANAQGTGMGCYRRYSNRPQSKSGIYVGFPFKVHRGKL